MPRKRGKQAHDDDPGHTGEKDDPKTLCHDLIEGFLGRSKRCLTLRKRALPRICILELVSRRIEDEEEDENEVERGSHTPAGTPALPGRAAVI